MSKRKDGGPAFARSTGPSDYSTAQEGMSLRDYFAAHALAACVLAYQNTPKVADGQLNTQSLADMAYLTADAMLDRRKS